VNVYEDIRFGRLTKVVPWMKAISAAVGRMKSGLALQDFNSVEMDGPVLLFGLLLFLFFDGHRSFAIVAGGTLQQAILRPGSESELNRDGREDPERKGKSRGIDHKRYKTASQLVNTNNIRLY
jgi:hypothetical protein